MSKVTSLHGGVTGERVPDEATISILREWLEMAESGELVGVVLAGQSFDAAAFYGIAGHVESYSLLGALTEAQSDVLAIRRGDA